MVSVVIIIITCPNSDDLPTKKGRPLVGTISENPKRLALKSSRQSRNNGPWFSIHFNMDPSDQHTLDLPVDGFYQFLECHENDGEFKEGEKYELLTNISSKTLRAD